MRRRKIILFTLLLCLVGVEKATAEYCWMIGCAGDEGYIRIPAGQIYRAKAKCITLNNTKWKIDDNSLLFKTPGVPKVNSVVLINKRVCFASNWSGDWNKMGEEPLDEMIKYFEFTADDYVYDNNTNTVGLKDYLDYGCLIGKGSKVKILKYVARKVKGGEALFARIRVLSDENF